MTELSALAAHACARLRAPPPLDESRLWSGRSGLFPFPSEPDRLSGRNGQKEPAVQSWQVQEAKARFSELMRDAAGPIKFR